MARDTREVERAAQDLAEHGARVLALRGDVRGRKIAQEAIDRAAMQYGRIDLSINNAGVIQTGPVEQMTIQDFEDALAVTCGGRLISPWPRCRICGGRAVGESSIFPRLAV
jgi:NAD(P)-dependent dehydrogenase (short-subunit alcohol dehydrogenase family)